MQEPYETEREAAAAARHIYDTDHGTGAWRDGNLRMLEDACRGAGVQVGAYDYKIPLWLTTYEPSTCAVVAGLITRAHAGALTAEQRATVLAALDVAADCKTGSRRRPPDCEAHPRSCAGRASTASPAPTSPC